MESLTLYIALKKIRLGIECFRIICKESVVLAWEVIKPYPTMFVFRPSKIKKDKSIN